MNTIVPSPGLTYPFEDKPEIGDGSAIEVVPDVLWLRMPLSSSLPAISVWAIADGDGWTIVDTGLRSTKTTEAWRAAFKGVLKNNPVTRVISTHMHPDHCGMAGWLVNRFSTRLWMSRLEYLTCRLMAADTGHEAPADGVRFYKAAGWDEESIETYKARFGGFGESIYAMPASFRRIRDGDTFTIGAHEWRVIVGNGHSPEHACLYCPALKVFISGDQVLPRISSNVSVFPTEPDANPLGDWLTSLTRIKGEVPDDVLVLPAHNYPFRGLHARLGQLIDGHVTDLEKLQDLLAEPKRVIDVFGALFRRPINGKLLGMATGEAVAHLNYLVATGRATRDTDSSGVNWWRAR
jgi:glyoxylase-like metal-dependent hydrolase (beta-lactamase superfamily II)